MQNLLSKSFFFSIFLALSPFWGTRARSVRTIYFVFQWTRLYAARMQLRVMCSWHELACCAWNTYMQFVRWCRNSSKKHCCSLDVRKFNFGQFFFLTLSLLPLSFPSALIFPQVAGLKYKVNATVNGSTNVVIGAFKPLPHTGNPLEIQDVTAA